MEQIVLTDQELFEKAYREENVTFLCRWYFKEDITPLQAILIRKVAFAHHKRLIVSATTRWGKTFCVARGIALYILTHPNKKIVFLGPQITQALILRNELATAISKCEALRNILDVSLTHEEKLTGQVSKAFQTFKNGASYQVFTTHDQADSLMGHGANVVIIDEAAKVSDPAYVKIMRMLGDSPSDFMLIELLNPWDRSCKAFVHWSDPNYVRFHVDWKMAVKDGRTTKEFIELQRLELTDLEFEVLYNSNFPKEAEDSIFNLERIKEAEKLGEIRREQGIGLLSCDPAAQGLDKQIIMYGSKSNQEPFHQIEKILSENKSDTMQTVGQIADITINHLKNFQEAYIIIDRTGLGEGVYSGVVEFITINKQSLGHIQVIGANFGAKAKNSERFLNKKAEGYFRIKDFFDSGMLAIPKAKPLVDELLSMKWKFTSKRQIQIIDPKHSPNFADALMLFCWDISTAPQGRFIL